MAHDPPNNIPHAKYNYNEDWDGWRPTHVYRRMNMVYNERKDCEECQGGRGGWTRGRGRKKAG